MGNRASLPEKVHEAVAKNDYGKLQALVADFGPDNLQDPVARVRVLEHKDKYGRTPLITAAAKNHFQILKQLIHYGADVGYINPSKDSAGSALHEAAIRKHEGAVELLLAAGANPFAANACGRTALEEAVLAGHASVARCVEKYADFTGKVAFKVKKLGGLSSKHKERWAVLMPYYPYGSGARPGPTGGKVRRFLWLYKDRSSVSPKCRLWVDGATVMTHGPAGAEGTIRLHTSHAEPVGDLATTFDRGYCVHVRPASHTPEAAAAYQALLAAVASPVPQGPYSPKPLAGAAATPAAPRPAAPTPAPPAPPPVVHPPQPQPPAPYPSAHPYPSIPQIPVFGGGAGAAPYPYAYPLPALPSNSGVPSAAASGPNSPPRTPGSAPGGGALPQASPLTAHHQRMGSSGHPQPNLAPLPLPPQPHRAGSNVSEASVGRREGSRPPLQQQPSGGGEPLVGSGSRVIGQGFIEAMHALPGESDEDFAARLASAVSATTGYEQQYLITQPPHATHMPEPGGARPGHAATRPTAASAAGAPSGPHAPPPAITSQSEPGDLPASLDALIAGSGDASAGQQQQQRRRAGPSGASSGASGRLSQLDEDVVIAVAAASVAGAPYRYPPHAARPGVGDDEDAPSAPVAPFLPGPPQHQQQAPPARPVQPAAPPPADPEAELCIVCMTEPKAVGFLHGATVHVCVCRSCAGCFAPGRPCPLCRADIERVLGVY